MKLQTVSIKKNFIMNTILTISSFLFPLVTFPYVSRVLMPIGVGKVAFAVSLISYFTMFAQLGIPTYGIRVCAKVRDNRETLTRTTQELLIINLIMVGISYSALAISIIMIPKLAADKLLYIIVGSTVLLSSIGMEWLYKALEKYTYITIRSLCFKIVALIAMFALIHSESDYIIYGGVTIFAASASNVLNLINAHKYIDLKPIGQYHFSRHIKPIVIFFAMACATTVYTHVDTVMLGFMTTDQDVGYYYVAVRIKEMLVSVVTSLGAVLLPRASYMVEHGQLEQFRIVTGKAINFIFVLTLPLCVYFIILAKWGVTLLSGKEYMASVLPMQLMMPTLVFIGLTNILGLQVLVPTGREKLVLYSVVAGATVDIIVNFLLIPKLAATGAAIGTLSAEFIVLIIQLSILKKDYAFAFKEIAYYKIIIGVAVGTIASIWVLWLNYNSFITLAITSFLFFLAYGAVLILLKEKMVIDVVTPIVRKILLLVKRN